MAKLRKILVVGVMSITILSMSMLAVPVKVGAAAVAGDLIKMSGLTSVYYLAGDGKRYVFPNEKTYTSWYSDFSLVKTIPQSELESYPLGKNVTQRPGTKLVKITTNPKVYSVEPGGKLSWVPSETVASTLWGADWAKRVIDVSDAFWNNYTETSGQVTAAAYPNGSLIKYASSPSVYYIDAGKARKVADEASFLANRFKWDDVVTAPASVVLPAAGADISGAVSTVTDTSSGAGGTIGAGTGLTIALSGTTAPSTTILAGQAAANLASFNLTASNDGSVKVTQIKFKKTGLTGDTTLTNVYLYEGVNRLTDSASVSSGYVVFVNSGGIVTVPAGQTKTVTVKSDILSGTSGQTVGMAVNAAADVVTDGASVSGSFPVTGNLQSVASVSDLATVDFLTGGNISPAADGTPNVQNDYMMWQDTMTVGQRAVDIKSLTLRQISSAQTTDLGNFRLYVDGVMVGSAVSQVDANGYIAFDLSAAPKRVETGNRVIKLIGDINGGSTRKFRISLEQATDVVAVDSSYGVNILATANATAFASVRSAEQTIGSATFSLNLASDSPSSNVIQGGAAVTIAKYTLKVNGEPLKIQTIRAAFISSTPTFNSLRNAKLMANGVQIGSTASLPATSASPAYRDYTVNYVAYPGTDVALEVVADIYDDSGTNAATSSRTLQAEIVAGTALGNARGQVSLTNFDFPSANKDGNVLTIQTGGLTLAKTGSYSDQTTPVPQTAYRLGSYVLSGNANEDVNLNTFTLGINVYGTITTTNIRNVYIKYGSLQTTPKASVSGTNSISVNYTIVKNGTLSLDVYGDVDSGVAGGASTTLIVSGSTAQSGQTANSNSNAAVVGQNITIGNGTLKSALDGTSPVGMIVRGNQTAAVEAAKFRFTASNETFTVTEIVATTTSNGGTVIVNALLKDGTTVLSTQPVSDSTITFSGLSVVVAANSYKVLTVAYELANVGTGAGTSGANIQTTLSTYKAQNSNGTQKTQVDESPTFLQRLGRSIYVYKGIPTIANQTLPTSVLVPGGTNVIYKFSVSGDPEISWGKLVFKYATSSTAITGVSSVKLYDSSNVEIPTGGCGVDTNAKTITCTPTTEEIVAGSKIYQLKATVTGGTTNDYISTSILQPSGFIAPAVFTDAAGANGGGSSITATFVWSDESSSSHDMTSTLDWNNDYLVKSLPTDSQTLTK